MYSPQEFEAQECALSLANSLSENIIYEINYGEGIRIKRLVKNKIENVMNLDDSEDEDKKNEDSLSENSDK
jgi:hypothetical protein